MFLASNMNDCKVGMVDVYCGNKKIHKRKMQINAK